MKKLRLFLLTLVALIGGGSSALSQTVMTNYIADFYLGESFSCSSDPFFSIGRDWKHIAEAYDDDGIPRYMSYSYSNNLGVDETGTILAYKQYACDPSNQNSGKKIHDMLVSPMVSGEVTLKIKGSISATSSYPSFVEFYKVNENGTEYGEQITNVTYYDADENEVTDIITTGWITAKINVTTATRIGIRGQNVYMDNFTADEATIMPEKKLRIASATPTATTGTIKWDQQPNGKVLVKYTVTVTNTGETDFAVGDDGYSVSIYNRKTGDVYGTTNVPEALAPNATSAEFDVTAEVEPTIWPNSYTFINMDLKENISGSFVQRAQSHYNEYAPKFVFRAEGTTSTSNLFGDIAFGKITEQVSKTYEIYNDGTAPLQVKAITVPEGFTVDNAGNFTLAAKEKQTITITLPVTTPGIFSGNLEIVYVDKTGADASYTKSVTGTVLDASKNIITFDDGAGNAAYPQGSVRYNAYINSEVSGSDKNYYLQGSTPNPLYITPLMTAEDDESITFDAMYSSYSGNKVEVMISTDRQNWTTIQTVSNIASQYNWTTYTATIPDAGNYYLGFKLTSSKVDNIYGLVYATAPAHDLLIVGENIPATATQNKDYTATVNVGNVGPNVETAGTYTASLYVNGEEVATANNVDLPVAVISGYYNNGEEGNYKVLSFTYKPHTPGTFPAYIEVKAGDVVLKTSEVSLVIAEEKTESDLSQETNGTTNTGLLHMNWNNSESVSLYSKTVLANMGLVNGDKISSITFKGYNTGSKNYSTTLNVWYEFTTDETQASPSAGKYDTSEMTNALSIERSWANVEGSQSNLVDLITINFETPITYDSNKGLRIVICSEGTQYQSGTYFENSKQSGNQTSYYNKNDTYNTFENTQTWSSNNYLPAIHLGLVVEPTTLAGTVTDGTNPVQGATVTLRNEANDVEYSGTTGEGGAYSINVIQDQLTYDVTVVKGNQEDFENNVTINGNVHDFVLRDVVTLAENQTEAIVDATDVIVKIERAFKAGWNAIVLPISITAEELAAIDAEYELASYAGDEGTGAVTVNFTKVTDGIEAGVPYMLYLNEAVSGLKYKGKDVSAGISNAEGATFDFVGVYTQTDNQDGDYIVQGGKFRKAGTTNWVLPFRSYLKLKEGQQSARSLNFVVSDGSNATTINAAEINGLEVEGIYNLNGQKVQQPTKRGLYIINGKKVLVK